MTESAQPVKSAPKSATKTDNPAGEVIDFASITPEQEALYCATAVGWEPGIGDELWMTVLRVQITTSQVDDANAPGGTRTVRYPLVTGIRDGQREDEFAVNVHAFHTVLAAALAAQRPVRGDRVYIRRLKDGAAKAGNREGAKMYACTVTKPSGETIDPWDQWAVLGKG